MICDKCGKKIKAGTLFCGNCGNKVEVTAETEIKKKKSPLPFIIIGVILILAIIAVIVFVVKSNPKDKYEKQLEIAERFLNDMDYEAAVAAYKAAIEIDPKKPDAIIGLTDAYIAWINDELDVWNTEIAEGRISAALSALDDAEKLGADEELIEEQKSRIEKLRPEEKDTEADDEEAETEKEIEVEPEQPVSRLEEGKDYFYGIHGKDKDIDQAESIFQEVLGSDETNNEALYYLGRIEEERSLNYNSGTVIWRSYIEKSKAYYDQAVEAGNLNALYSLGYAYYNEHYKDIEGADPNGKEKGAECFKEAYDKGCKAAGLGMSMLEDDYQKEMDYLKVASESEELTAKQRAFQYMGLNCVPDNNDVTSMIEIYVMTDAPDEYADLNKALEYFNAANETELGEIYSIDEMIAQAKLMANGESAYEEALEWYKKGAELGGINCYLNAAHIYAFGPETLHDDTAADEMYKKAVEIAKEQYENSNNSTSQWQYQQAEDGIAYYYYKIGRMGYFAHFLNSAEAGSVNAMRWVGYCYQYGIGTSVSVDEARKWYEKVLDEGQELGWVESHYNNLPW